MGTLQIISDTPLLFQEDNSFTDPRFMKVRVSVMHSGRNKNGSFFSTDVIKQAEETFKNISILANVVRHVDKDGTQYIDFGGHDMHLQDDIFNEDQSKVIYDERVVGIVPETNDFEIVHDDQHDWDVVYVTALLFRDYGNYVCDILNAKDGETDVSAEIYCPDIEYDADNKVIVVNKMIMSGVTLLGSDRTPAMTGAKASVFEIDPQVKTEQMLNLMSELKSSLDNYISTHSGKPVSKEGGKEQLKFKELLEKYKVTEDQITFETEGLSDEELEQKFVENFAKNEVTYSVKGNTFSVELDEIYCALSRLVQETYADDEAYYSLDIYPEDHELIMHTWGCRKGYKQKYSVDENDMFSLVGDRVEVESVWLTADEKASIDNMKANYSEISEKLKKYEDEPKKVEILNSDAYSAISEDAEFKKLCSDHFDLSIEDVSKKADEILLANAKSHKFEYAKPKDKNTAIPFPKSAGRDFGEMFNDIIK